MSTFESSLPSPALRKWPALALCALAASLLLACPTSGGGTPSDLRLDRDWIQAHLHGEWLSEWGEVLSIDAGNLTLTYSAVFGVFAGIIMGVMPFNDGITTGVIIIRYTEKPPIGGRTSRSPATTSDCSSRTFPPPC